jgi:tRNA A37 threonylcarbamoyladenosine dehydratase
MGVLIELVKLTDFGAASNNPTVSREDERAAALARRAQHGDYDDDLVTEQLTRTASFLGPERFSLLRASFVVVVGLGGVGSHCTSALARSGVSKIRLIDFDQVTLSSLNRHAVATLADVGTPKVDCVRKRLQAVVPWAKWECFNEVWKQDQAEKLLGAWERGKGRRPDYVVDAIDNIDSKVALLQYCYEHRIKVVSSMGAGCKSDPTRVCIDDISMSVEDPLSRVTRRKLRAAGISEGVPVVFSTEKPGSGKAQLLPLPEEEFLKGKVNELSVLPDFRARILPVLGTMPAIFGYTAANFIVCEIAEYPHETGAGKAREKMYDNILSALQSLEERLCRKEGEDGQGLRIPVTKEDVGYLVEEVYRGKSVISKLPTRLALIRWNAPSQGFQVQKDAEGQKTVLLNLSDLVLMTREEAVRHEKEVLKERKSPESLYSEDVLRLVDRRREEEKQYSLYR